MNVTIGINPCLDNLCHGCCFVSVCLQPEQSQLLTERQNVFDRHKSVQPNSAIRCDLDLQAVLGRTAIRLEMAVTIRQENKLLIARADPRAGEILLILKKWPGQKEVRDGQQSVPILTVRGNETTVFVTREGDNRQAVLSAQSSECSQRLRLRKRFSTDQSDALDVLLLANLIEQILDCNSFANGERPRCTVGATGTLNRAALHPQGSPATRTFDFRFRQKPMHAQNMIVFRKHKFRFANRVSQR